MPGPAGTGGFIGRLEHGSSHPSTVLATVAVFNESRTACLSSAPCCFCTPASRTIPETHAAALRRAARQAGSAKRLERTKLFLFISFVSSIQERDAMFCNNAAISDAVPDLANMATLRKQRPFEASDKQMNASVIGQRCCWRCRLLRKWRSPPVNRVGL